MRKNDKPLELDREPTPKDEAQDFSTPDEKADTRAKHHELDVMKAQMGPIGRLIGSTDSSKTIAFVAVFMCLLLMCFVYGLAFDRNTGAISDGPMNLLSLLGSIVTGCIGFIFGSRQD